jgi:L-asparaginase
MNRARVYIAYTGGTAGMKRTPGGYKPEPGWLQALMKGIPQFHQEPVPEFDICQYDPLLDSSNMTPSDWVKIASDLLSKRDAYDGFLVIHGTDTMAYTASALSFLLLGFGKPVLITGSQIPLEETRNDAQENLLTALIILGRFYDRLQEVCICFDNKLLRGNRASKVDSDGFDAFASPNLAPLATAGVDIRLELEAASFGVALRGDLIASPAIEPRLYYIGNANVTAFWLFPGLQARQVANLVSPPVQGAVMACFGSGNAPSQNAEFMATLERATAAGVVIVGVTQPAVGSANLDLYATGRALREAGVVSGFDLTLEAALTKLMFLLDLGLSPSSVRRWMQLPLAGELTRSGLEAEPAVDELLEEASARPLQPSGSCAPVRKRD